MASGLNRVMLLGDVSSDPELYVTRSGKIVLHLRLATTESFPEEGGGRRERVSYHPVVVFGRRAEALRKSLTRGARVFVEGSLRTSVIEGKDGKKRYRTEIVASEVLFAGERVEVASPFEAKSA